MRRERERVPALATVFCTIHSSIGNISKHDRNAHTLPHLAKLLEADKTAILARHMLDAFFHREDLRVGFVQ